MANMNENDIPNNENNEAEAATANKTEQAATAPSAPTTQPPDATAEEKATDPEASPNEETTEPQALSDEAANKPEAASSENNEAASSNIEGSASENAPAEEFVSEDAQPTSYAAPFAQAKETAIVYLKKAARFLGLNKKASAVAAAVALCVVVGIGAAVSASTKPQPSSPIPSSTFVQQAAKTAASDAEAHAGKAAAGFVSQSLTPAALNSIDSFASAPSTFSLVEGEETAQPSDDQLAALTDAAQGIENGGHTIGFALINLNTGKGIGYNLDSRVYGASSFKGPYGAYLCQHLGDADATYPAGAEAAGAGISSSIDSLLQPMIIDSDNNAFSSLRNSYDSSGFAEWLSSCGVDSSIMHDTHFPRYSARESALLWLHTYQYLETDTPTAQHLASLYAQTNVSFIRAGVGSVDGVETVRNKAGWCASGARFTGLCDAGLIECADGTTYLMSTMTNAPDDSLYTVRLSNLANALFACRDALD